MNILWIKPDKTLAITSAPDAGDVNAYAKNLQDQGDIDASWTLAATNVIWPENPMGLPQECFRWVKNSIIAEVAASSVSMADAASAAIGAALDAMAQSHGYDDVASACRYASQTPAVTSSDPNFNLCEKFRREGNALQSWMSLTWAMAISYSKLVATGSKPMLTAEQAVAAMPVFTLPA